MTTPKLLWPRRLVWWWLDYAYATYWQVRSVVTWKNPADYHSGHKRPIVVIPGIYESWQFLRPLIEALHDAGHPVHVVTRLQRNRLPVIQAARLVSAYIEEQDLRGVAIVAHSKGGLIGKFVMLQLADESRIRSMVAVCSPFSGSRYARYMMLPSLRAFSPRDETTNMLAQEVGINARITSIFGAFDPHIPEGSVLPGAANVEVAAAGHFRILGKKATVCAVLAALAD